MNLKETKQAEYWSKEAQTFDSIYSDKKNRIIQFLDSILRRGMYERFRLTLEYSHPIKGRIFLDIGCGSGRYCLEFARQGAKKVVGIDFSEKMLRMASESARQEGLAKRCEFINADITLFTPQDDFDVSIAMGLFDYIKNPFPVLEKMKLITKDYMLLAFPRLWSWRTPLRKLYLGIKKCDVYFYSQKKIDELMKKLKIKEYKIFKVAGLFFVKVSCC